MKIGPVYVLGYMLIAAASALPDSCGKTLECPVTPTCPKGECSIIAGAGDGGTPTVGLSCKEPKPEPTASPTAPPVPSPPAPPTCIAAPTTAPGPGRWECGRREPGAPDCCLGGWAFFPSPPTPPPSPLEECVNGCPPGWLCVFAPFGNPPGYKCASQFPSPSAAPPSPLPTAPPSAVPCATVPADPVPVVYTDARCRDLGLIMRDGVSGPNGEKFCTAPSACKDADEHCNTPSYGITPEMLDGATDCRTWASSISAHTLNGTYEIRGGYLLDVGRGYVDAYGRQYREDVFPPTRNSLKSLWKNWGRCPPQAAMPCATPPPPTPPPGPSPSPPATPPPGTVACADGKCPKAVDIKWGANQPVKKPRRGCRNTGNVTAEIIGCCLHKNDDSPSARCAIDEGCGDAYATAHGGHLEAFQTGDGWNGRASVEYQSNAAFTIVDATNSDVEENWLGSDESGWTYRIPGKRTFCVSLSYLDSWSCRNLTMTRAGCWADISDRYTLPKAAARSLFDEGHARSLLTVTEEDLRPLREGSPEAIAARKARAARAGRQ